MNSAKEFQDGFMADQPRSRQAARLWPQLRRFLIFQLKLYIDAFRDFGLSLLSIGAFVLDLIMQCHGPDSFFEKVLQLGRRSERVINLFEQYDPGVDTPGVDKVIRDVEKRFRRDQ